MVTDEMVDKAADEMARQDIMFANCDRGWQKRTIRAALEAALSATEPAGFTLEMKTSLSSNWFRDFSFEPLKENDFVRNVRPVYAAPPAPPVAVKALDAASPDLLLYNLITEAVNEGVAKATDPDWTSKDFVNSPSYQAIHSALSAQVQDVAGWLPADEAPRGTVALIRHRSGQIDYVYKTNNGEPFLETWRYAGTASHGQQAPWPEYYLPISALPAAPAKQEG